MLKDLKRRKRNLLRTTATLLTATVGLVGLTIGSAGAAVKPKQLANITIALSTSSVNDMPLWVGQSEGFFAAQGLNVKVPILSASTVTPALLSGSVQYLSSSVTGYMQALQAGDPIQAFDADIYGFGFGVIFSNDFISQHGITAKTPTATIAKDMIGSTGGASATGNIGAMTVLLNSFGVSASQVSIALFSSATALQAAFSSGRVSWFNLTEPTPFQLAAQGQGQVLMSPNNVPAWGQERIGYNQVIEGTTSFIAANPGLTRKVAHAIQTSAAWLKNHELKSVDIATTNLAGVSRNLLFNSIRLISWAANGKMNGNKWRTSTAYEVKSGQIPHGFKVTENVNWTNKYL